MDARRLAAGLVLVGHATFGTDVIGIREYSERCADYYARAYGVSSALVRAIIQIESGWQPGAVSSKGAMGLMQLMPATAEHYGVTHPFYIHENIRGGVAYLADLQALFGGDLRLVVAAYAAGERPILAKGLEYSSPEVYSYVQKIAQQYRLELIRAKGKQQ
jgi:soluble lytic murein transglycosylase-like protein